MALPIFEIFQGNDRQHYWRLKAPNGEIIAVSEGYSSKQMAKHGINSVKENSAIADIEEVEAAHSEAIINHPSRPDAYMGPLPTIDDE